jgi:hypothetical protein
MKGLFCIIIIALSLNVYSQKSSVEKYFSDTDSLYREDQFYIGLGVNFLLDRPDGMRQSGFSGGFHLGYIRDMPLNLRRNISIGVGLGLSINSYTQNLFIGEDQAGQTVFDVINSNVDFSENRFSTQLVEVPVHFRWRTSDIGDNKSFWRIYSGLNIGYMYYFKSVFRQTDLQTDITSPNDLNRIRYAFYFAFGKSKINFFFRYSLNPLFDGQVIDTGQNIGVDEIKAGLVFYIL